MPLITSFLTLVQPLAAVMTRPTFERFLTLLSGWVFARRRTVTAMLVAAGVAGKRHHAAYHRVFAAARWCLDEMGFAVFALVRRWVVGTRMLLSLDDTLARKRGKKTWGVGMHHDPLISSRKRRLVSPGGTAGSCSLSMVRLPFAPKRTFSLPVLFRLYLNKAAAKRHRRAYRSRPELAVELLERICTRHPELHFHAFADSSYGGQSVLRHLPGNCDLTSRLALNARLYAPPAPRKPRGHGPPSRARRSAPAPLRRCSTRGRAA